MLVLFIFFAFYPVIFGVINALIYGRKGAESYKIDEHYIIILEIAFVYGQVEIVNEFRDTFSVWDIRTVIICILFCHPLLKQAGYFEGRNLIDGSYPKGWMDDSTTSTAKINFTWWWRVALAACGVVYYTYYCFHRA